MVTEVPAGPPEEAANTPPAELEPRNTVVPPGGAGDVLPAASFSRTVTGPRLAWPLVVPDTGAVVTTSAAGVPGVMVSCWLVAARCGADTLTFGVPTLVSP